MMLSTKGRYAVMAMVDLAINQGANPVSLAAISDRQEIPLPYLEQIFGKLRKAGIIDSVRGPGGGYNLSIALQDCRINMIIEAVEESTKMTRCDKHEKGCMKEKSAKCLTHDLWHGLEMQIDNYLGSISLLDLVKDNIKIQYISEVMHDISRL